MCPVHLLISLHASFRFGKMVLERLYFWSGVFPLSFFTKINDTLFLITDEEEA